MLPSLRVNFHTPGFLPLPRRIIFVLCKYLFSHMLIIVMIMLIHEIAVSFDFFSVIFFVRTMEDCKIKKSEYPYINHAEAAEFCHMKDMKCVAKTAPKLEMRNVKAQKKICEKKIWGSNF